MNGRALPTVETEGGRVEGTRIATPRGPVCVWRGIPYATAERFGPPGAPVPWSGIRPAVAFGPGCPQSLPPVLRAFAGDRSDEDCLVLNVFTRSPGSAARPVMVWIHGGAFIFGSADLYDAAHLVAGDDIVVVTINYRLGALGFLDVPSGLGLPSLPSNPGLHDMIAALRWVRDNIAGFGGNPSRVTLAGESAGSIAVSLLMLSSDATPLFHGAILQSGAINLVHDAASAADIAHRAIATLNLQSGSPEARLAALRALPVSRIMAAQHALHRQMPDGIPTIPWFDGSLLPPSLDAARRHPTPPIPLLAGSNRDEIRSFEIVPGRLMRSDRAPLRALLHRSLGADAAARILAAYADNREGNRHLGTDLYFAMPTRNFVERHAVSGRSWLYRFDIDHPVLGAAHGLELLYLFDLQGMVPTLFRGGRLRGARAALAQRIRRRWIAFIRDGDPGADWPAYAAPDRTTLLLDRTDRLAHDPDGLRRSAWDGRDAGAGELGAP